MPYLGRTPAGAAGNVITGDLKVTGAITADVVHDSMILDGTDGSSTDENDNMVLNGTDGSSSNADDRLVYEEETGNQSANSELITNINEDIKLAFLQIAKSSGDRLNMVDGIADPYQDETDVTNTNGGFDSTSKFYSSRAPDAIIDTDGLTFSGDFTHQGGLAAAFDGNKPQASSSGAVRQGDSAGPVYLGVDWGSGVTNTVKYIKVYAPTNTSFHNAPSAHNIFFDIIGHTSDVPGSATDLGEGTAVTVLTGGSFDQIVTINATDVSTAFRFHWVDCHSPTPNATWHISELEFYGAGSVENMTLLSDAFTADTVPTVGRIHVQIGPQEAITVNTDFTAEISRDGGTTFTTANLTLSHSLADGSFAYEDNDVDISGQPSGTAMKYRLKTLNTKEIRVFGTLLQWK